MRITVIEIGACVLVGFAAWVIWVLQKRLRVEEKLRKEAEEAARVTQFRFTMNERSTQAENSSHIRLLRDQLKGSTQEFARLLLGVNHSLRYSIRKLEDQILLPDTRSRTTIGDQDETKSIVLTRELQSLRDLSFLLEQWSFLGTSSPSFVRVNLKGLLKITLEEMRQEILDAQVQVDVSDLPEIDGDPLLLKTLLEGELRIVLAQLPQLRGATNGAMTLLIRSRAEGEDLIVSLALSFGSAPSKMDTLLDERLPEVTAFSPLCQRIMDQHGGTIRREGGGTEITLPRKQLEVAEAPKARKRVA